MFDRSFAAEAPTAKEAKLQCASAALDAFMKEEGEGGDAQHIFEHGVAQSQPLGVKIEGLCSLLDDAATSERTTTSGELKMVRLAEERLRAICHEVVAAMDFENLTPVTHCVAAFLQTTTAAAAAAEAAAEAEAADAPAADAPAPAEAAAAAAAAAPGASPGTKEDVKVVSLAAGGRIIEPGNLTRDGRCLTDSHCEVLARRGLVRYLALELARDRGHERGDGPGASSGPSSVFKGGRLRDGVKFHLYVSVIPCGDAKRFKAWSRQQGEDAEGISRKRKHSEVEGDEDPKEKEKEKHEPEVEAIHCGQMCVKERAGQRAFPSNATRDTKAHGRMSCSDKILKWTLGGLQGRALAAALPAPVRLSSVVVGSGASSPGNLQRALCCRAPGGVPRAPCRRGTEAIRGRNRQEEVVRALGKLDPRRPQQRGRRGRLHRVHRRVHRAPVSFVRPGSLRGSRGPAMAWMLTKETGLLAPGNEGGDVRAVEGPHRAGGRP